LFSRSRCRSRSKTLTETNANFDKVAKVLEEEQQRTGIKLLWGTANLFSNPRFVHGAATSCNADVFAYAGAQVKKCLEVPKELGGETTSSGRPRGLLESLQHRHETRAGSPRQVLHLALEYKKKIGFTGQFLIEPKPKSRRFTSTISTPPTSSPSCAATAGRINKAQHRDPITQRWPATP